MTREQAIFDLDDSGEQTRPKESLKRASRRLEKDDPLQMLSPEQVAQLLCVSRSTVDRMVATGRLPSVPLTSGRRKKSYRVRRKTLEEWLSKNEQRS